MTNLPAPNHLSIQAAGDGDILIVPSIEVSQATWLQVQSWWNKGDLVAIETRRLSIHPSEFTQKMSWLREVWVQNGFTVFIEPEVIELVRIAKSNIDEFTKLLGQDPRSFELEKLTLPRMKRTLTPNQNQNVQRLLAMKNGANFSVPGAGKTMMTLALWHSLRLTGRASKLLVVCPKSAFESWITETSECLDDELKVQTYSGDSLDPDTDIVLVNYEQLEAPQKIQYLTRWATRHKTHLVVDEAHRVKAGGASVRWASCKLLALEAIRVDVLTGTPMPQGPADLSAIFRLAWPALPHAAVAERALLRMKKNTAFVRTTKSELNLPPIQVMSVREELSLLHEQIYSALKDQYAGSFELTSREGAYLAKKGKAVMTLIAAATNPSLLLAPPTIDATLGIKWPPIEIEANTALMQLARSYLKHEIPWKFKFVARRAEELRSTGQKLIVWSSFVGNLKTLKRILEPHSPALVYGGTPSTDRKSEILRFRNDPSCTVLLTNPQTLGEGISLHKECHEAIYVDRTFNAGHYLQSLDRIHRLGLASSVETKITILESRATVDERVGDRLERKIKRLSQFLDDPGLAVTALPEEDNVGSANDFGFDDADFASVFSHLRVT
jgi:superfamily II DNA or RNA helicase